MKWHFQFPMHFVFQIVTKSCLKKIVTKRDQLPHSVFIWLFQSMKYSQIFPLFLSARTFPSLCYIIELLLSKNQDFIM